MPADSQNTIAQEADSLLEELRLSYQDASVATTKIGWLVMIWRRRPKPRLREWKGKPVVYRIGGGPPKAFAA